MKYVGYSADDKPIGYIDAPGREVAEIFFAGLGEVSHMRSSETHPAAKLSLLVVQSAEDWDAAWVETYDRGYDEAADDLAEEVEKAAQSFAPTRLTSKSTLRRFAEAWGVPIPGAIDVAK